MSLKTLQEHYRTEEGKVSDRWQLYLDVYEQLLAADRDRPLSLLEIGVQNGGSLEIWSRYFPNAIKLVGCDINPRCTGLHYEDPRIAVIVGDANNDVTEAEVLSACPAYDLIIDDGSHASGDIVRSFARYFQHLRNDGLYIVEDLHCSYWATLEGGLFEPYSSISFFKRLIDVINYEHWGLAVRPCSVLEPLFSHYGVALSDELRSYVNSLLSCVYSITFFNSLCIIRKQAASSNVLGNRIICGAEEPVTQGLFSLRGTALVGLDQTQWSNRMDPIAAEIEMGQALTDREHQIATLIEQVADRERQLDLITQAAAAQREDAAVQRTQAAAELEQATAQIKEAAAQAAAQREDAAARLAQTVAQLEEIAGQRTALIASTSWRITRPLRLLVGLLTNQPTYRSELRRFSGRLVGTLRRSQPPGPAVSGGLGDARQESPDALLPAPSPTWSNDYEDWVRCYDSLDEGARQRIRSRIADFYRQPKISVVMPVYDPALNFLDAAIRSVRNQLYPNWELCIADDASTNPAVRELLNEHAQEEVRIKLTFRATNGHICAASNTALAAATGEYVALLDNDDVLSEHALFWVAQAILDDPEVGLVYSDEDKISEGGSRYAPYFKCDLNMELLLAQNMISHLGVYRRDLLEAVGGFRVGFEGSQDYDLALRVIERLAPAQVKHIPRVLYHWRAIAGSTALASGEKNYAAGAGRLAVAEHLQRRGLAAEVGPALRYPHEFRLRLFIQQ